jgi:hypothetical protein
MPDNERDIMGRDAARLLNEQIVGYAKELIVKVETRLKNVEGTTPEEWDQIKADLDRNIMAFSVAKEKKMLNEEQEGFLTKMESQLEYLDRVEKEREGAVPEAA